MELVSNNVSSLLYRPKTKRKFFKSTVTVFTEKKAPASTSLPCGSTSRERTSLMSTAKTVTGTSTSSPSSSWPTVFSSFRQTGQNSFKDQSRPLPRVALDRRHLRAPNAPSRVLLQGRARHLQSAAERLRSPQERPHEYPRKATLPGLFPLRPKPGPQEPRHFLRK